MTVVGVLAILVIAIAVSMVLAAVAVGITGAWFLSVPFSVGWDAAWDKPFLLFAYVIVVGFFFSLTVGSR